MNTIIINKNKVKIDFTTGSLLCIIFCLLTACDTTVDKKAEINLKTSEKITESTVISLTLEQMKTVNIQLGSIENKQLTATLKVNGTLKVPNSGKANVTSLYGGVIKTLNVSTGSYVQKGQIIATITNPEFIQLQEEYLNIISKITFAEQEVARQKELNEGNAGTLKNLQAATAEMNSLQTRKASLYQQIQLMGINPNQLNNSNLQASLKVTSPMSGTVSNIFAKIGSYIDVSSPVAEIVDNTALHLDLNVFEKDLPMLAVGQMIHFTLTNNPNQEYDAKIYRIGTAFENDSKTIPVHCTVEDPKTGLIDGMNITAIVSLNDLTQPAVPNDAIVETEGKDFIFIVTDQEDKNHPQKESEEKTITSFRRIEIIKGISNVGYTVITLIDEIPKDSKIVTKGAFFINAKLVNKDEHGH